MLQRQILPKLKEDLGRGLPKPTFGKLARHLEAEWLSAFPLRAYLVKLGSEAGYRGHMDIIEIATALELAQLASLIIDDVVDHSDIRNGASANKKFGENVSVLTGEILKACASSRLLRTISRFSLTKSGARALECFESTYLKLCTGQLMDIWFEGNTAISESRYMRMISLTTASFLEGAVAIGAILSGASKPLILKLRKYAWSLGMALQIYDDVLDLLPQKFPSKPVGQDIRRRKQRLPLLHYLHSSSREERAVLCQTLQQPELNDADVRRITGQIIRSGSLQYAIDKGRWFSGMARNMAQGIEYRNLRPMLLEFIDFLQVEDDEVVSAAASKHILALRAPR